MKQTSVMNGLYKDAIFLKDKGRLRGCLCILLCIIDGLAKSKYPTIRRNRERYITFLKSELKIIGIDESVRIEEKDDLLHLSEIIYEYLRCNIIHEGDTRESLNYEVQLEFEESGRFKFGGKSLMDRVNKKLIYDAQWFVEVLFQITDKNVDA
jgi:hypothetical protein